MGKVRLETINLNTKLPQIPRCGAPKASERSQISSGVIVGTQNEDLLVSNEGLQSGARP